MRQQEKDEVFLDVAKTIGKLGTCPRGAVGAVITRAGRAISWGYNGAPPGLPHCEENGHGWVDMLSPQSEYDDWQTAVEAEGCRNATHAEANALAFAARQGISTDGASLYCECAPCPTCSRLIIAAGIGRVVYEREYRDPSGVALLNQAGVHTIQILGELA